MICKLCGKVIFGTKCTYCGHEMKRNFETDAAGMAGDEADSTAFSKYFSSQGESAESAAVEKVFDKGEDETRHFDAKRYVSERERSAVSDSGAHQTYSNTGYSPYDHNNEVIYERDLGMKWFKFLIYFSLFAGAITNFVTGIGILCGGDLFDYIEGPRTLIGLISIAFAIFMIVTRFMLAKFKRSGLIMYYVLIGLSLAFTIVEFIVSDIFSVPGAAAFSIGYILGNVVYVVLNIVYFKKRADMFK